jgi:ribosome-associated heat shock protein Hsp15
MHSPPSARIDKWLWAVRLFRSRSAAIAACHAGQVKIAGARVKPAREIRPGDTLAVLAGGVQRTVRVRAAIEQRVGAAVVPECLEELTPLAEFERARMAHQQQATAPFHDGGGRPTKKQRRELDALEV